MHGCLVDRNADGRFEAMFMFPRPAGGMVLGGGYVPAQTRPVDVAYREAAPEAFTGKPNLHIQYDGCELGGRCSLTAFVGERNAYGGYLGEVTFKAEDFGKPLDLAGARIIVSGKKGGWITVQIVSPIPEGKVDLRGLR